MASDDPAVLKAFLKTYPKSTPAPQVRERLRHLEPQKVWPISRHAVLIGLSVLAATGLLLLLYFAVQTPPTEVLRDQKPATTRLTAVPSEQPLAKADITRGENAAKRCQACHTFTKGGRNLVGPNLWGVVGRPKASEPGFNYSAALKAKGGNWTIDDLNQFITNSRGYVPGTTETFAGISGESERADLLVYLNSLSDNPAPLPRAVETARAPEDDMGRFVSKVLGSTELQWQQIFAKDGRTYSTPELVFYRGSKQASCDDGAAQSAIGPFYCPANQKVYLDTSFFDQIATRFRGCDRTCQFSQAYVIAHEVDHHVQNLLGILPKAKRAQRAADSRAAANHIQVQVELQADCLAGVWANRESEYLKSQDKPPIIDAGDVDAALRAVTAIGDDTLQRKAQVNVVPDSFTHGSAEQRHRWFNSGFRSGSLASCNTFGAAQL
jgi:predicted metalloprotease